MSVICINEKLLLFAGSYDAEAAAINLSEGTNGCCWPPDISRKSCKLGGVKSIRILIDSIVKSLIFNPNAHHNLITSVCFKAFQLPLSLHTSSNLTDLRQKAFFFIIKNSKWLRLLLFGNS